MNRKLTAVTLCKLAGAIIFLVPTSVNAQGLNSTTPDAFLEMLETLQAATEKPRLVVIQGVATAATMPGGTAFASISGTTRREGREGIDGSLAFGVGFGDAQKTIGAQIVANITSAEPDDFGDSGSFSVKLSRALPASLGGGAIGLTFDNQAPWGDVSAEDVRTSVAWTTASQFPLSNGNQLPLLLNFGVSSESDYHDSWTPFGAIGFGLSEAYSMTLAHNGDYAILGVTARWPGQDNMSVHASLLDAFDQRDERRVTLTASFAFNDLF